MDATIIKGTRNLEESVYDLSSLAIKSLMEVCKMRYYRGLSQKQMDYLAEVQKEIREFKTSRHAVKFLNKKLEIEPDNFDKIAEVMEQYYNSVIKSINICKDNLSGQEQPLYVVLDEIKEQYEDYMLTTI